MESPVPQKPTAPPAPGGPGRTGGPGGDPPPAGGVAPAGEPAARTQSLLLASLGLALAGADSAVAPARALEASGAALLAAGGVLLSGPASEAAGRKLPPGKPGRPYRPSLPRMELLSPGFGTAAPGLRGGLEPLPGGPGPPHPQAGRAGGPAEGASGGAGRPHGKPGLEAFCQEQRQALEAWDLWASACRAAAQAKGHREAMEAVTAGLEAAPLQDGMTLSPQETRQALEEVNRSLEGARSQLDACRGRRTALEDRDRLEAEAEALASRVARLGDLPDRPGLWPGRSGQAQRELQSRFAPRITAEAQDILKAHRRPLRPPPPGPGSKPFRRSRRGRHPAPPWSGAAMEPETSCTWPCAWQ